MDLLFRQRKKKQQNNLGKKTNWKPKIGIIQYYPHMLFISVWLDFDAIQNETGYTICCLTTNNSSTEKTNKNRQLKSELNLNPEPRQTMKPTPENGNYLRRKKNIFCCESKLWVRLIKNKRVSV